MSGSIGRQCDGYGWEVIPRRARSLFGFLLTWLVVATAIAGASSASTQLVGVGDGLDAPQTDGRYIFGTNTKDAKAQGFRYRELVRVDTTTGKRRVVVRRKKQFFSDLIAGGGKIAAVISFSPRVKGVLIAAGDGTGQRVVSKIRPSRPSTYNNVPCGKSIRPSSISTNGDVVVELVQSSCKRTLIQRKFLIFRSDGRRQIVSDPITALSFRDSYPLFATTQLVGDQLLVADREARLFDVGYVSPPIIWSGGLDGAALGFDRSIWISAVGSSEQHGYWSALLRAPNAGDDPIALATSRQPEISAVRFLPVACGDRLLVLRSKLVRSRMEDDSLAGLRNDSGALRLGGSIGLDLYQPDGTLQQTLAPVRMRRLVSLGCDQNGLTLVGRSGRGHEYIGVAF